MSRTLVPLLAPPYGGKTTLARVLAERFGDKIAIIGTGNYFRRVLECQRYPADKKAIIDSCMEAGEFVPDYLVVEAYNFLMEEVCETDASVIVLDGVIRNCEQGEHVHDTQNHFGVSSIVTLQIEVPTDICVDRLRDRMATENRSDDDIEKAHRRLADYTTNLLPLVTCLGHMTEEIILWQVKEMFKEAPKIADMFAEKFEAFAKPGVLVS